jgi:prepilin signal peptidase PulO-like enzyme (type II secretory pathway)
MLVILALAVGGLIFGSFIDALIWRIHEQSLLQKKKQAMVPRDLTMLHGRSMCPNCRHTLSPWDLIPVVSWVLLRGKCRYCGKSISWQVPVVELLTGTLFVLSYIFWPTTMHGLGLLQFCFWLAFLVGFVALIVYDLKWYILPDRIVYPLIVLAVIEAIITLTLFHGGWLAALGSVWGVLIASGIFYVLYQISDGAWIGGGDVKLGVVLGILLGGPLLSFMLLFLASVLGTLVSIPLLVAGRAKRSTLIPFGPFLIAATIILELFATHFVDWLAHFSG